MLCQRRSSGLIVLSGLLLCIASFAQEPSDSAIPPDPFAPPITTRSRDVITPLAGYQSDDELEMPLLILRHTFSKSLVSLGDLGPHLVEAGLDLKTADEVDKLCRLRRKAVFAYGSDYDKLELSTGKLSGKDREKYILNVRKSFNETEQKFTRDLIKLVGERNKDLLGRLLFGKYHSIRSWTHPLGIELLGLTDEQVARIDAIAADQQKWSEDLVKGAAIDDLPKLYEKDADNFSRSLLKTFNALSIHQVRQIEIYCGTMEPGMRWSQWLEKRSAWIQANIGTFAPAIAQAIREEDESGILTP